MYCNVHQGNEAITTCIQCGSPLCSLCASETNQIHLCHECYRRRVEEIALQLSPGAAKAVKARRRRERKIKLPKERKAGRAAGIPTPLRAEEIPVPQPPITLMPEAEEPTLPEKSFAAPGMAEAVEEFPAAPPGTGVPSAEQTWAEEIPQAPGVTTAAPSHPPEIVLPELAPPEMVPPTAAPPLSRKELARLKKEEARRAKEEEKQRRREEKQLKKAMKRKGAPSTEVSVPSPQLEIMPETPPYPQEMGGAPPPSYEQAPFNKGVKIPRPPARTEPDLSELVAEKAPFERGLEPYETGLFGMKEMPGEERLPGEQGKEDTPEGFFE